MRDLALAIAIGGTAAAVGATACNAILGITDVPGPAEAGVDAGGETDASRSPDAHDASMPRADSSGADGAQDAGPGVTEASASCDPQKTQDDPANCGSCGHDCLGGGCSMGACKPFVLFPGDGGPVVQPSDLAQDDAYLYWTDTPGGAVRRTLKTTGATSSLLPLDGGAAQPRGIAVDDSAAYWGDVNGVYRCAKAGCVGSPKQVASGNAVASLAIDDAGIYWSEGAAQILAANKLGTGEVASVIWQGGASTVRVASDGQRVYFTAADGLLHAVGVDGGGGVAVAVDAGSATAGVALSGGAVYWTVADPSHGVVLQAPTSSLVASPPIITQQQSPHAVATDGTFIYWVNLLGAGAAQVMGCPIASCGSSNKLLANAASPSAIVVDSAAIYWTDIGGATGAIYKLAR
jgi:hypothetical protein